MVVALLPQESAFGNKLKSGRGYLADHLRFLDAMHTRNSSEISSSGASWSNIKYVPPGFRLAKTARLKAAVST
jgi:hypothetical protein